MRNRKPQDEPFEGSDALIKIIESHDWQLYDATQPKGRETPITWLEFESRGPTRELIWGHNYLIAPRQAPGLSLRDTYKILMGLGPSIRLDSLKEHIYMDGVGGLMINGRLTYFFSRLCFHDDPKRPVVNATSAVSHANPNPPSLIILPEQTVSKFQRHFEIISPEEFHRWMNSAEPVGPYSGIN